MLSFTSSISENSKTMSKSLIAGPNVLMYSVNQCNKEKPTVFIILTGWNDKYNRNMPLYYKVPYSSHSNYRELEKFVKAVCPRKLIFNVDDRGDDCKSRAEFQ